MTNWSAQRERGGAGLVSALAWLLLRAGWPLGRLLLWPAAGWFLLTSPGARAASRDYLTLALGRPARLRDVARHFHTFAGAVLDRLFLMTGRLHGFHIRTEGLEHVRTVLDSGRGCILLGAHLGSFEVLRHVAQASPVPVWALMFRRNAGALTGLLDRLAPDLRDSILEVGDTASMLRAHECVERGEIVGILADRAPPGHRAGVAAPFLGRTAQFPAGPFVLASTLAAPVVLFQGLRLGPRRYLVRFEPFAERVVLRRASRAADLAAHAARYAAALERGCRAHPYNWFNFFPFWAPERQPSERPPGLARRALPLLLLAGPARAEALDLAALMAGLAAVPERRATFRETRRFAALNQPLESTGRLLYRRPGHLEKLTDWPERESLVVDGDRLVLTGADAPRVVDLAGQPELRGLVDAIRGPLSGDLAALRRAFAITATGTAASWSLGLAPLDPRAARLLRGVLVEGAGSEVLAIRLTQANGDEQDMRILPAPSPSGRGPG